MLAKFLGSQGENMSGYCPQWVYSACIGLVIKDFIEKDIPLDLLSRKYGKELSEKYDEINHNSAKNTVNGIFNSVS